MREITNEDLWAAVRGLGMARMTGEELEKLAREHQDNRVFASQVIAKAAWQMASVFPKQNL